MTVGVAATATDGVPKPVIVGCGSMYSLGEKLQVGTVSVIISRFISTRDRAGRLDSR